MQNPDKLLRVSSSTPPAGLIVNRNGDRSDVFTGVVTPGTRGDAEIASEVMQQPPIDTGLIVNRNGDTRDVFTGATTPGTRGDAEIASEVMQQPPMNTGLIVNPNGDEQDFVTGAITPGTTEDARIASKVMQKHPTDTRPSSQNDITLSQYRARVKQVPTITVQDPSKTSYFPQDARYDPEIGQYEAHRGASPAPRTVPLIIAKEKKQTTPTVPAQSAVPILTPPAARVTPDEDRHPDQRIYDGIFTIPTETPKPPVYDNDSALQDALDPNRPISDPLRDVQNTLAAQNTNSLSEVQALLDENARRMRHQEALDSNARANEDYQGSPLSNRGQNFFRDQDQLAEDARREAEGTTPTALELEIVRLNQQIIDLQNRIAALSAMLTPPIQNIPAPDVSAIPDSDWDTPPEEAELQYDVNNGLPAPLDFTGANLGDGRGTPPPIGGLPEQGAGVDLEQGGVDIDRINRDRKRSRIISGAITTGLILTGAGTGFAVAVTVASAALTPIGIGIGLASVGAMVGDKLAAKGIVKTEQKIANTTDPIQKAKLEKRLRNLNTVRKVLRYVKPFVLGASIGFTAGSIFRSLFLGGESILNAGDNPAQNGGSLPKDSAIKGKGIDGQPTDVPNSPNPPEVTTPQPPTQYTEGPLVRGGRVDLPGSAWNGNMGGPPTGNLADGITHTDFTGGVSQMGAYSADQALAAAGVTRDALFSNMSASEIHTFINLVNANPGISVTDALTKVGTDGARALLATIQ